MDNGNLFRPAPVFIGACILLSLTVGLRWSIDPPSIRFIRPIIAALLPPIAWLCFTNLQGWPSTRAWPHFLAPFAVAVMSYFWQIWRLPIDPILAMLYFAYGVQLLRSANSGPDDLENMRLTDADGVRRSMFTVAGLMIFSGVIDLMIFADFSFNRGTHVTSIVATANLAALPIICYAIAIIGRSVPESESEADVLPAFVRSHDPETTTNANPADSNATAEDFVVMDTLDAAMKLKKLYRDPDLTLDRLSRRLAIPSRKISSAINRINGHNVSQVVNGYRIRECMRLLTDTDLPITDVMFECGFRTKSNFNKEFARVSGTTPSDYRRSARRQADDSRDPMA
ncbi:AraC-like DNA-binding protein [Rhizobium sp. SG_E_25_P2]|nr:AraC-like DNA-binding protein [Rhizobium sp. SG_E_25_P2]